VRWDSHSWLSAALLFSKATADSQKWLPH